MHFYTDVLGLEIITKTFRNTRQPFELYLALNGIYTIELFSFPNPPKRRLRPDALGLRHIAIAVDDLDKEILFLPQKGIVVELISTNKLTNKRFTFFVDPDDLPIEFYDL